MASEVAIGTGMLMGSITWGDRAEYDDGNGENDEKELVPLVQGKPPR